MDGSAPSFCTIALAALRVWSGNPRKTVGDVADLAASIRAHGVAEPLLVRPVEGVEGITHEILAGQRRYLASTAAGLVEVPCIVRELPDDAALELGLIENSQRENPSPLEEAEAIDRLTREHGRTIEAVADKLGRTPAWVRRRLTLLSLCEAARERMRRGELPLAHAERLAAVDEATQARVLSRYSGELPASGAFARDVALELHAINQAPFDVDDAKLPGGSCAKCPKRSDTQVDLFGGATGDARCLDAACWAKKNDASWERAQRDAKKRKLPIIDAKGVLAPWGVPGTLEYTAPYLAEPPTPDAQPVAIARHFRGHVIELYEKPARVAAKAVVAKANIEDDDEPSAEEVEREERAKAQREAKTAAERAKIEKLLAVTQSGRGLALLWRVALHGLANAGFERDLRAVVAASGGVASPMLPVDELVSADEAPRVLAAALVQEWANDDEDHTDAEKELRALLDAPLAVEAPAPSVGCVDCGDAAALLRPGETVVCVCGKKHTRTVTVPPIAPEGRTLRVGDAVFARDGAPWVVKAIVGDEVRLDHDTLVRVTVVQRETITLGEADLWQCADLPVAPRPSQVVDTARLWISESVWDALTPDAREDFEEPIGGLLIDWQGAEGWVWARVPRDEVLVTLRGVAEARGVELVEGEEQPAPVKVAKKARAKKGGAR